MKLTIKKIMDALSLIRECLNPTSTHTGEPCYLCNLIISVTPEEVGNWDQALRILKDAENLISRKAVVERLENEIIYRKIQIPINTNYNKGRLETLRSLLDFIRQSMPSAGGVRSAPPALAPKVACAEVEYEDHGPTGVVEKPCKACE